MTQPSYSKAALEMQRYLKELGSDDYWIDHQVFDEDLVTEELAARLVDAQSVQELMTAFEAIDDNYFEDSADIGDLDLLPGCALEAFVAVEADWVVDVLIQTLTDPVPGRVIGAAIVLGRIGHRRAMEPLIKTLQHPQPIVRATAVRVLGQIGDATVLDTLIALLNDSSVLVREEAATALSKRADERVLEPLVAAFYRVDLDEEEMFPLIIIGALRRLHTPAAESALLDFLKITPNHSGDIRYDVLKETMIALAEMGSKTAVDPILQALSNEKLRGAAARALGILGEPRAVNLLIPLLDHPDAMLRGTVAQALGRIRDPRALPALRHTSQTDHEYYATGTRVSDLASKSIALIEAPFSDASSDQ